MRGVVGIFQRGRLCVCVCVGGGGRGSLCVTTHRSYHVVEEIAFKLSLLISDNL